MSRRATPPGRCRVCQHPDRDRLDERLALDQDTPASLAGSEGLPFLHVWDHRARHLDAEWAALAAEVGPPISREQLRNIAVADLHDVRSIARDRNERPRTRYEASSVSARWAELITRHLVDDGASAGNDSPTVVVQVMGVLRDRLNDQPEAMAALDAALEGLGSEEPDRDAPQH